jgi:DNA polymerase III epsilon subunit-like protein
MLCRTEGIVLLAHNARFDYNFIREETIRAGLGRFALGQAGVVCIVDTLKILRSRSIWQTSIQRDRPPRPSSFSLGSLHEYLVSKPIVSSHNALSDVLALEAVLSHIEPAGWKELASQPITQSLVPTSDKQLQELIKSSAQSSVSRRESR